MIPTDQSLLILLDKNVLILLVINIYIMEVFGHFSAKELCMKSLYSSKSL